MIKCFIMLILIVKVQKDRELTTTVRTTPPLAPSRAIARETAFTTNFCRKIIIYCKSTWDLIIKSFKSKKS